MTTAAIDVSGLVKVFGETRALDGLDLRVAGGEVHGLLGPGGAGKTTALQVLLGLLRADAGRVRLLGGDPWDDGARLRRRLAYVIGDADPAGYAGGGAIDPMGSPRGHLRMGRPGRRPRPGAPDELSELYERFGLDPAAGGRYRSPGDRRKAALAAALASDAELLVLDEPAAGLDAVAAAAFHDRVAATRAAGRTVLLSGHVRRLRAAGPGAGRRPGLVARRDRAADQAQGRRRRRPQAITGRHESWRLRRSRSAGRSGRGAAVVVCGGRRAVVGGRGGRRSACGGGSEGRPEAFPSRRVRPGRRPWRGGCAAGR